MAILMLGDAGVEIFSLLVDRCSSMIVLERKSTRAGGLVGSRRPPSRARGVLGSEARESSE